MADVFLSYAREDLPRTRQIVDAVSARGWSVWWDFNLTPGARYRREIGEQLLAARCVVVLWSKAAIDSDYVLDEAQDGKDRNVLVQALIENVRPPYGFRQIETANLTEWDGGRSGEFERLCAGMSLHVPPPDRSDAVTVSDLRQTFNQPWRLNSGSPPQRWKKLEQRFASLADSGVAAETDPRRNGWQFIGPDGAKRECEELCNAAGELLLVSPTAFGLAALSKSHIDRWVWFVAGRVGALGRIAIARASAEACAYCAEKESQANP
jgi:hypothetical protein